MNNTKKNTHTMQTKAYIPNHHDYNTPIHCMYTYIYCVCRVGEKADCFPILCMHEYIPPAGYVFM